MPCFSWLAAVILAARVLADPPATAPSLHYKPIPGAGILSVARPEGAGDVDRLWAREINTHAYLLRETTDFAAVVSQPAIRETRWFKQMADDAAAARWLHDSLRVAVVPGTSLIEARIDARTDERESVRLTEDVINVYLLARRKAHEAQLSAQGQLLRDLELKIRNELNVRQKLAEDLRPATQQAARDAITADIHDLRRRLAEVLDRKREIDARAAANDSAVQWERKPMPVEAR